MPAIMLRACSTIDTAIIVIGLVMLFDSGMMLLLLRRTWQVFRPSCRLRSFRLRSIALGSAFESGALLNR